MVPEGRRAHDRRIGSAMKRRPNQLPIRAPMMIAGPYPSLISPAPTAHAAEPPSARDVASARKTSAVTAAPHPRSIPAETPAILRSNESRAAFILCVEGEVGTAYPQYRPHEALTEGSSIKTREMCPATQY